MSAWGNCWAYYVKVREGDLVKVDWASIQWQYVAGETAAVAAAAEGLWQVLGIEPKKGTSAIDDGSL